jgi:penicillin-binding protein 1C
VTSVRLSKGVKGDGRDGGRMRGKPWIIGLGALALGALAYRSLPQPLFRDPYATVALDRDGGMLGAKIAADGQWRFPPLEVCPSRFAAAAIAYEDRRFLHHPGVDPFAVARAIRQNLTSSKVISGGSTLTMQVIRMSRGSRGRTWPEKIVEAFLALRLELGYGKQEILALYASHAPFGGNVVGLEAAAWRYFGRPSDRLSWGEAALLAVLPNSPALMHPGRNREPLRRKRDRLLVRLWRQGGIDSVTCALARLEPLPGKPVALPRAAPHLVERLARERPKAGSRPAAIVRTSLDGRLQAQVDEILLRRQRELDGQGIRNGAVLVLRAATGEVVAYAGNMRAALSGDQGAEVDIITSRRSTGSLLKPFLYASMLEAGELLPGTLVADVPTQIAGYAPENFDRAFEGAVPARLALARSLNVPAVRMLKGYGVERFHHTLQDLGFATLDRPAAHYGLTLVLGGAEGTLWDLCGMYAGLARESLRYSGTDPGAESRPGFFAPRLTLAGAPGGPSGASAPARPLAASPIGPASAWLTLQAMAEVSRPDAQKYWRDFASSRWVAWKTGTSFGFRDAWAVGVTPEFVVGVWVGNATGQGRPGMTGIQVAAPLLFDVYNALPPTTEFPMPMASLKRMAVCPSSGMRPGPLCPAVDSVWAPQAGLRTSACPYHRMVHLDSAERFQVHDGCQSVSTMVHRAWFILPPTQEWYYRQRHSDYLPLPEWRKDCEAGLAAVGQPRAMELIYPKPMASIYIPTDLNAEKSRAIFEAVHRNPGATLYWHLDQSYLGETREFHKMTVNPSPGPHTLLLVDDKGERLERAFEVLAKDSGT